MTLPANWDLVPVRGKFVGTDGTPLAGYRIIFTPRAGRLTNPDELTTLIGRSKSATLDENGAFEIYLPATDDPDVVPTDFTFTVKEDFPGGSTYDIEVPLDKKEEGIELALVAPTPPASGTGGATPISRLEIGSVSTGAPGSPAEATITGTPPVQHLNLVLPRGNTGPKGDPGNAATVAVGDVTSVASPTDADVQNVGTPQAAVLDFYLPRGEQGNPGPPGPFGNAIAATLNGGLFTVNPAGATDYLLTLTADSSLSATGMTPNTYVSVTVVQDGTGGHALALPSSWGGANMVNLDPNPHNFTELVIKRDFNGYLVKVVHSGEYASSNWTPHMLPTGKRYWWDPNTINGEDGDEVTAWASSYADPGTLTPDVAAPILGLAHGMKHVKFSAASQQSLYYNQADALNQPFAYAFNAKMLDLASANDLPIIASTSSLDFVIDVKQSGGGPKWCAHQQPGSAVTGDWQTVIVIANGANSKIRVDGIETTVSLSNGLVSSGTKLADGAHNNFFTNIHFGDIVSFEGALGSTDLLNLEEFLKSRRDIHGGVA